MIVLPSTSHSDEEKSRAKITNEWQVRRICSAIWSTVFVKAFFSTSNVTGIERVEAGLGAHCAASGSCSRMFSHSSTSARQPGGTTTVESNPSTIAGPSNAKPAGRSSRR